jgi:hypothetical protein
MFKNLVYATIKYIPKCDCPLNGIIHYKDYHEEHGIICSTCWKMYEPEIVYHNIFEENLKGII